MNRVINKRYCIPLRDYHRDRGFRRINAPSSGDRERAEALELPEYCIGSRGGVVLRTQARLLYTTAVS